MRDMMSSRQRIKWAAFAAAEPFGDDRADLRAALQTAMIVNAIKGVQASLIGKKVEPMQVREYLRGLPRLEPKAPVNPVAEAEQVTAFVEMLNAALGGVDLRERAPTGAGPE